MPLVGAPSLKFQGGYAQAGYVLTGEGRSYNAANAAYNGVKPAHPFSLEGGGWGAWEIAGRFSTIDLNDQLASANGVAGGRQNIYTLRSTGTSTVTSASCSTTSMATSPNRAAAVIREYGLELRRRGDATQFAF